MQVSSSSETQVYQYLNLRKKIRYHIVTGTEVTSFSINNCDYKEKSYCMESEDRINM